MEMNRERNMTNQKLLERRRKKIYIPIRNKDVAKKQ